MSATAHPISLEQISLETLHGAKASGPRAKGAAPFVHQPIRLMQALAILMVVYAHSVIPGHHHQGVAELFDRFVRAVGVPLFMSISGFLYCLSNQSTRSYARLIKEKANRLLLPYAVLSSLAYIIKAGLGHVASRPIEFTWTAYFHQMLYPWDNVVIFFWFLPTLFFLFVISVAIDKLLLSKGRLPLPALLVILTLLSAFIGIREANYPIRLFNLFGVLNYLINFWAGYAICKYEPAFCRSFATAGRSLIIVAIPFTLAVALPDANHAIAVIQGVLTFAGLLALGAVFTRTRNSQLLSFIGDSSYQIYLLSWFFQTMPIIILSRAVTTNALVCGLASFLLGVSGPLLVAYGVRKKVPIIQPLIGFRRPRKA